MSACRRCGEGCPAPLPLDGPHPGEHYWISREQMAAHWPSIARREPYCSSCLWCGTMKRGDGKPQKPCRGIVGISLRYPPSPRGRED